MVDPSRSRRDFLKAASVSGIGLSLGSLPASLGGALAPGRPAQELPFRLGVASYSLRKFSREDAIRMIKELDTPYVNIKSFHLPEDATAEEIRAGRGEFEAAGLTIVGGGTINMQNKSEDELRASFEYAKAGGFPLMVIAPTANDLPAIETLVKEYGIAVAIHNHGPEDEHFPAPKDALVLIKDMDPRVGLCVDVGHTARTGVDVVDAIAEAGDRVLDMHMKDLADMMVRDSQCIVGEGKMPVAAIFKQLQAMNYQGCVNLEYEINEDDPLPGMERSFAFMRGVIAGLTQV